MKIRDKRRLVRLLADDDQALILAELQKMKPSQAVNPLFAGLSHGHEKIRWHAISAMGPVVASLADSDLEAGRVVMRRLMWSLNDESGGIGWGAPEAMAEIMVNHQGLAAEFSHILVSYMREDGNFLELPALQRGLLWGVGRLAQIRKELLIGHQAPCYLPAYLAEKDTTVRGMAIWALGLMQVTTAQAAITEHTSDHTEIRHYQDGTITTTTVAELAHAALKLLKKTTP